MGMDSGQEARRPSAHVRCGRVGLSRGEGEGKQQRWRSFVWRVFIGHTHTCTLFLSKQTKIKVLGTVVKKASLLQRMNEHYGTNILAGVYVCVRSLRVSGL